jgi:hypothetical protein
MTPFLHDRTTSAGRQNVPEDAVRRRHVGLSKVRIAFDDRLDIENGSAIDSIDMLDFQTSLIRYAQQSHPMQSDRVWAVRSAGCEYAGQRI